MARVGVVIVLGAIVLSIAVAMFMYTQYQTNFIKVSEGESVKIGPVEYLVTFDGTHEGNKETIPDNTFLKIKIHANNLSDEKTRLSGGQFYLIDEKLERHIAIYGEFSPTDLLVDWLEPNKPVIWTTQFDVPYEEEKQYKVIIRPSKQQSTVDVGEVCIANC